MPLSSLRRLAAHAYRHEYAAGEPIFFEGGEADRFMLIQRGLVKLDIEVANRGRIDVEVLAADSALGWSWLFAPYRWHLSATAIERTTALVFDAGVLRARMAGDPVLGYELMRRLTAVLFDRVQVTRQRLSEDGVDVPVAPVSGPWAARRAVPPSMLKPI